MPEIFKAFLSAGGFIPHGHCYLWLPELVWLHIVSDSLIALAYYSIPVMLVYFVRNRRDMPFDWVFLMFGAFIVACGTTHLLEVWTLWHPTYWLSGFVKAITALVSLCTAVLLVPLIPQALALPSPAQLEAANLALRTEITQRQQAQEALRESEERLLALLSNAPAVIYLKDLEGRFILVNHQIEDLFQVSQEQILGKSDYDFFPVEMADAFRENDQQVLELGTPLQLEEVATQDDGIHTYISIKFPLYHSNGIPYGLCGISTDITDRKRTEEALRRAHDQLEIRVQERTAQLSLINASLQAESAERKQVEIALQASEQQFRATFSQAAVGIAQVGTEGQWLRVNQKLCDIVGYTREELLKLTFQDISHPDELDADLEYVHQMLAGEIHTYSMEKRYIRKDSSLVWINLTASLVRNSSDEPQYFISVIENISDRKRQEEEIRLLQTITQAISEAPDFHCALEIALRKVCEMTRWNFGEAWIPQPHAQILELSPAWYSNTPRLNQFRQASEEFTFPLNAGIPGRVLASKQPEWTQDVSLQPETLFMRTEMAQEAGIKAALGVPIVANVGEATVQESQVLAIFVFFTFESYQEDKRLVEIVSSVANQLGLVLQRKRAEETLRESEQRFRAIFNQAAVGIIQRELDGRFLLVNQAYCELVGYTREELLERNLHDLTYPDDRDTELDYVRRMLMGEMQTIWWEKRYIRKDGSVVWVNVTSTLVRNVSGEAEYFLGVIEDISDRKQAEEALRESEHRYATLARLSPVGIYRTNAEGEFLYVNRRWREITGLTREKALGDGWVQALHPDDRDRVFNEWHESASKKIPFQSEYRFRTDKGVETWVLGQAVAQTGKAGEVIGYVGIIADISDRKRTEEALKQSEECLRLVLQNMPVMMDAFDANWNIIVWNRECERVTGFSAQEIVGNPRAIERLYPNLDYRQQMMVAWAERGNDYRDWEWEITCKDGSVKLISWSNISQKFPISGWASWGVGVNITDRKRAEQEIRHLNESLERRVLERTAELAATNKELEAFSYSVSHDLRAPLRGIDGFSQTLLNRYADKLDDKGKHYLQRIRIGTQRMGELIDDLLQLSRVTRSEMHRTPVDLSGLAQEIAQELQQTQPSRQVEWAIAPGLIVDGDARLLQIVLENLLNNAWKFTSSRIQSHIELNVLPQEEHKLAYFVRDNGAGFDMAYADKLFGAFQRLHSTAQFTGTGIGLATVQRIIHRHGGQVWAKGVVDVGATFYFTL